MRLLTVATLNYIEKVIVLFKSARQIHPEFKLTLLLADCSDQNIDLIKNCFKFEVDILFTSDLEFEYLEEMRKYYSVVEYCSALKVLGSAHILKTEKSCLFLDPDMVILDRIETSIFDIPGNIAFSCHSFSPYPNDQSKPDDLELSLSGHINGGVLFTRCGDNGNPALDCLVKKTKNKWFMAPALGMYADHQWLSALPYFFNSDACLIADRGINVVYWNLHERPLRANTKNGKIIINSGESLKLMHFSGFTVPSGGRLSIHSSRRFDLQTEKIIKVLTANYERALIDASLDVKSVSADRKFSELSLSKRINFTSTYQGSKVYYISLVSQFFKYIFRLR